MARDLTHTPTPPSAQATLSSRALLLQPSLEWSHHPPDWLPPAPGRIDRRIRPTGDGRRSYPPRSVPYACFPSWFGGAAGPATKISPDTLHTHPSITEALCGANLTHALIRISRGATILTHSATVNHGGCHRKTGEWAWANLGHSGHVMGVALPGSTPVVVRLACDTYEIQRRYGR
jgi:hypothetical protein